jgi:DNA-binding protein H-NS
MKLAHDHRRIIKSKGIAGKRKAGQNHRLFFVEGQVAKINLSNMSVESLMELRQRVDKALLERRAEMEKQLARMDRSISGEREARRGGGTSALRGRKVPPKYRGPSGETWAGRGARPRWLVDAMKGGKKLEQFLIDKPTRKGRKKRKGKRQERGQVGKENKHAAAQS